MGKQTGGGQEEEEDVYMAFGFWVFFFLLTLRVANGRRYFLLGGDLDRQKGKLQKRKRALSLFLIFLSVTREFCGR